MIQQGPPCCPDGVRGYGNTDSGIVVVGIAAGRDEYNSSKRPFTGPAGRLLDNTLAALGDFSRSDIYTTNICCQWNDKPEASEIEVCWPRFVRELRELKPKLIITLGDIPCQAVLGKALKDVRGLPIETDLGLVLSTYHPAAMFHDKGNERIPAMFVRDLQKIPNLLRWQKHAPIDYVVCRTFDQCQEVLYAYQDRAMVDADHLVSLDIETTNKPSDEDESDIWTDRLICIGLYDDNGPAYIFPAEQCPGLDWPPELRILGHNVILFDRLGMRRYLGVDIIPVEDTMYESYSLNEQNGIHRLETLSAEYCGAGQYKDETRAYYKQHKTPPAEANYKRCAYDVVFTYELHGVLKQKQIDDNVRGFYKTLLIPAANMLAEIQYEGMAISTKAMGDLLVDWIPRSRRIEARLQEIAVDNGWPESLKFNPASNQQVARVLFDLMKQKVVKRTPAGAISVDREVLDTFDIEFVDLVLDHRELQKAIGTYVTGIYDDVKDDKRLHPTPTLHVTRTGRGSYKNPPVQTIPQDKVKGHPIGLVRTMFVPDDEDSVLLESDYQQGEIWIGAGMSKCQALFEDLQNNIHSVTAINVLGASPDDPDWLDKRINAKKVTFGKFYKEGIKKLATKRVGIGCSIAEAAGFSARWDKRYWEFIEWQKRIEEEIKANGELISPFGRKRRFPIVMDHRQLRQAVNFPIQSTLSDYTLSSALRLHRLLGEYESRILLLIHDSLLMNVKRRHLSEVMALVREVMETPYIDWLPTLRVDMKVGNNWFEAHSPTEKDLELVA